MSAPRTAETEITLQNFIAKLEAEEKELYEQAAAKIGEVKGDRDEKIRDEVEKDLYKFMTDTKYPGAVERRSRLHQAIDSAAIRDAQTGTDFLKTLEYLEKKLNKEPIYNKMQITNILAVPDLHGENFMHSLAKHHGSADLQIAGTLRYYGYSNHFLLTQTNKKGETPYRLAPENHTIRDSLIALEDIDETRHGRNIKEEQRKKTIEEGAKISGAGITNALNPKNKISVIIQLISAVVGVIAVANLNDIANGICAGGALLAFIITLSIGVKEANDAEKKKDETRLYGEEVYKTLRKPWHKKNGFIPLVIVIVIGLALEVIGLFAFSYGWPNVSTIFPAAFVAAAPLLTGATLTFITSYWQGKEEYYDLANSMFDIKMQLKEREAKLASERATAPPISPGLGLNPTVGVDTHATDSNRYDEKRRGAAPVDPASADTQATTLTGSNNSLALAAPPSSPSASALASSLASALSSTAGTSTSVTTTSPPNPAPNQVGLPSATTPTM